MMMNAGYGPQSFRTPVMIKKTICCKIRVWDWYNLITFTFFKDRSTWETDSNVFSWLGDLELVCLVQSLFQNDQRPQNAHASAWWKEDPQLQPVRLLKYQCYWSENTHKDSQWREAFQLLTVQLLMHNSCQPEEAHVNPFWRKAFRLHTVQLFLYNSWCSEDAQKDAFWREAFQLQTVQILLHTS